jgi:uncharacterized protein YybS (DUF2232 family)
MPLKAILNSLIAGILSSIFTLGFKFFGSILIFFSYFSPLPIFLITFYYGLIGTVLSALISIGIITLLSSPTVGAIFFVTNILPALIISINKNNLTYKNFISNLTLLNTIGYISIIFLYSDKIKTIADNLNTYIREGINKNFEIEKAILDIAPSIIISSWTLILLLNFILARKILNKYFNTFKDKKIKDKIINLNLEHWIIILFLLFLIPAALLSEDNGKWFRSLTLIFAIPITIQGLVSIHFLFKKYKVGNFLIYIFYTIIFLIPISIPIITAFGVLEQIYNFRDLKKNKLF